MEKKKFALIVRIEEFKEDTFSLHPPGVDRSSSFIKKFEEYDLTEAELFVAGFLQNEVTKYLKRVPE